MARLVLKKDDLRPQVTAALTNATGGVIDLTSASGVKFIMKSPSASVAKVDAVASITTATDGTVAYTWTTGDTDTSGTFNAEFEVDWGSSVYQTFPASNYIDIEIVPDLGGDV